MNPFDYWRNMDLGTHWWIAVNLRAGCIGFAAGAVVVSAVWWGVTR